MTHRGSDFSVAIFALALFASFVVALLGRLHSIRVVSGRLSEHRLNRWLIGLSAGATANSGFVVTCAVGLGYLPRLLTLSWFEKSDQRTLTGHYISTLD
jgi:hypothetical protein